MGGLQSKLGRGSYGCGLWRNIHKGWEVFSHFAQFKVWMGYQLKFWYDCCCGDQSLKEAYPILYDIAIDKEASVDSSLIRPGVGERRIWDVRFFHDLNNWELEIVVDFLHILVSNSLASDGGDLMWWVPKKKGVFDIHSFHNTLRGSSSVIFPWKGI